MFKALLLSPTWLISSLSECSALMGSRSWIESHLIYGPELVTKLGMGLEQILELFFGGSADRRLKRNMRTLFGLTGRDDLAIGMMRFEAW